MLVLTRMRGEDLVIADNIVITVVEIRGNRVRLGISAPRDVRVVRREVAERLSGDVPQPTRLRGQYCPDCGQELVRCRCQGGATREAVARG